MPMRMTIRAVSYGRRPTVPARAGFTLMELLIVIAILAMLVALILPAMNRAKEQARQSLCMSNQRQILVGLQSYHAEWHTFPYNYAFYHPYTGSNQRWALGCLAPYVGGRPGVVDLRGADEGEFPSVYICPSADRDAVYGSPGNVNDKYHACYWTNVAVRLNRGFAGPGGPGLFSTWGHVGKPAGWDGDSAQEGRYTGKCCPRCGSWRSVYLPTLASVSDPARCSFSGDTNNEAHTVPTDYTTYTTDPGEWHLRPGWGRVGGQLGFDRHWGSMIMSYVDGHADRITWEDVVANYVFFLGSSRDYLTANPTGDFMMLFPESDVCDWPNGDFDERIHPLPEPIVE